MTNTQTLQRMQGIYPALPTPFDAGGTVNLPVLQDLVRFNLDKGVTGFYVGGSTAEAFLLSEQERMQALEAVMKVASPRARVIAHIGTLSTDASIRLARHAKSVGVDAISSVPPFYYGFTFDEIRRYYFDIVDAVDVPMLVYHFPANSGVKLTEDNIRCFLADPRFMGIKFTSNDFFLLERIKTAFPDRVVFNGYDEMFVSGVCAGADGGIGSTYNFMAEKFIRMRALLAEGRLAEAHAEQQRANQIISVLLTVGVIPGMKALLEMLGLPVGAPRRPFRTLTQDERDRLLAVFRENT